MRSLKSVLGLVGALVPILYCGYLGFYFFDVGGSVEEAQTNGLGPTILGLGIVGLLFCIPFTVKLVKLFGRPRAPGSGGRGGSGDSNPDGDFDPDAVIARYMARQSQQPASPTAAPAPAPKANAPAKPASFGRRVR